MKTFLTNSNCIILQQQKLFRLHFQDFVRPGLFKDIICPVTSCGTQEVLVDRPDKLDQIHLSFNISFIPTSYSINPIGHHVSQLKG